MAVHRSGAKAPRTKRACKGSTLKRLPGETALRDRQAG